MKRNLLVVLAILAVACWVGVAQANTYTFTETGNIAGAPVSGTVTYITSANQVEIKIANLISNPTSAGSLISDLGFILSGNAATSGSISSVSGTALSIAPGGGITAASTTPTQWSLNSAFNGNGFELTALGGAQPQETIIGAGPYTNANPSITGWTHEPVYVGTAIAPFEFFLNIQDVNASTCVVFSQLSFGTEGATLPGVPIPPSALLLGSGLLGLGLIGWRRKRD
jgi:hypothetical protein